MRHRWRAFAGGGTHKSLHGASNMGMSVLKAIRLGVVFGILLATASAADYLRGTLIRYSRLYLTPDTSSSVLGSMDRGRELVILETSPGWVHVTASLNEQKTVTGWIVDKGV